MPARVLIIEDEYALAAALSTVVRRLGAEPVVAASGQGGMEKAARQSFDAVLLDIGLPDISGLKVLAALRNQATPPPVLIITAHGTLENALEARRLGAHDYFLKPLNLAEIQPSLRALLESAVVEKTAGPEAGAEQESAIMIGAAPGMQRCFAVVAQACATEVPVLLTGPHGSGKTLAAQVIHRNSLRGSSKALVVFRRDEWTEEEGEAALVRALDQSRGQTLLVEEIGGLPLPLQALVARCLAEGGRRILATSSANLPDLTTAGAFREDLYYQMAVLQVVLPPLAERSEDIPALAAYLLGRAAPGRELVLSLEALGCLKGHSWPGHVRELGAAMQHAAAVCPGGTVQPRHLPETLARLAVPDAAGAHLEAALNRALVNWLDQRLTVPEENMPEYDQLLAQVEARMLAELLTRFDDKPTRLAAAMNMNRATLRRKLRELLNRE